MHRRLFITLWKTRTYSIWKTDL